MKALTRAEEQVMQILWDIERGFVKDIIEEIGSPKPAYNTVSTICRILEKKGFLDYKSYGNSHQYFPLVSREEYTTQFLNNFMKDYFNNSFENLVSFFSRKNKIKMKEAERIINMMNEIKKEQEND
jgi:BlaI family penicillinase repressor